MNTVLSDLIVELICHVCLWKQHGELEHFQKAVSILGSELNCEFKVLPGSIKVIVGVLGMIVHVKPGTLTPNLPTFWNLI